MARAFAVSAVWATTSRESENHRRLFLGETHILCYALICNYYFWTILLRGRLRVDIYLIHRYTSQTKFSKVNQKDTCVVASHSLPKAGNTWTFLKTKETKTKPRDAWPATRQKDALNKQWTMIYQQKQLRLYPAATADLRSWQHHSLYIPNTNII